MASEGASSVIKPVVIGGVTIGVAALALTTGGLLGVATVSVLGRIFGTALGESAKKLTEKGVETFTQKFLDKAAEPAIDGFRKAHPTLEDIYREAFRLSLYSIRPKSEAAREGMFYAETVRLDLISSDRISNEYADWFDNWDAALNKEIMPNLEGVNLEEIDQSRTNIDAAARCFKLAMERIDAQGASFWAVSEWCGISVIRRAATSSNFSPTSRAISAVCPLTMLRTLKRVTVPPRPVFWPRIFWTKRGSLPDLKTEPVLRFEVTTI